MPLTLPTWIGAIATVVLAVGAIITSVFAIRAFRKQGEELVVIKAQAKDQQALIEQQAEMIQVQSGQLEIQRRQFDDQQRANASQAAVLDLQAKELEESLAERQRDREERHRDQATRIFPHTTTIDGNPKRYYIQVKNASDRPVYNLRVTLHCLRGAVPAMYSFDSEVWTALLPGAVARFPATEDGVPWDATTGPGGVWSKAWFTDAAEVPWTVTSRGEITEVA